MAVELVIAAVGALGSLAAGVVKQYFSHRSGDSGRVTVTVERSAEQTEQQVTLSPEESVKVLEILRERSSGGHAPAK